MNDKCEMFFRLPQESSYKIPKFGNFTFFNIRIPLQRKKKIKNET